MPESTIAAATARHTASDRKQSLFVKEGKDVVFQKGPSSTELNGFPLSTYKHTESDMRVMLCVIPRSLFTVHIYVPTIANNDKGLPHTLEHLVFCGSKRYPDRGYLDSLANCNLSTGTNAWTARDHTCYTLSTASEEALANVLPVYLDHVLNPLLKDEQFVSEVYHYDQTGKEQGVVFSEMVACENDEQDLQILNMNRLMYAPGSPYTFETGGLTKSIAKLTNAEVIDYHRKFYDANNLTIVIAGPLSDQFVPNVLQTIPREIIQSRGSNSRTPIIDALPDRKLEDRFKHVPFPTVDTDTGSIAFGWHGPDVKDVETIIALDILLDYLAKNPSSPLKQRFVERSVPLAGDITHWVDNKIPTSINIGFSGVPYHKGQAIDDIDNDEEESDSDHSDIDDADLANEKPCLQNDTSLPYQDPDLPHLYDKLYFQNLFTQELRRVLVTKFDGDTLAMAKICQQVSDNLAAEMEDNPEEVIISTLGEAIVAGQFTGNELVRNAIIKANSRPFDIIQELGQRQIGFWMDLLRKWFCDAPIYYTAMVPDAELGPQLERVRKEIEDRNAASITDKDTHVKNIGQAMDASKVKLPPHTCLSIPMADITKVTSLPHRHILQPATSAYPIGPVSAQQLVYLDTNFVTMAIGIPLSTVSDELRPFIVLFQELVLTSNIVLPKDMVYDIGEDQEQLTTVTGEQQRIDYTEVTNRLVSVATSTQAAVGLDNDNFTCSMLDEFFMLKANITSKRFGKAIRWLLQAFMFAEFTAERILSVAQNLLSEINEWKRDGDQMVYTMANELTTEEQPSNMPRWMDQHISIFEQESVLKHVIQHTKSGNVEEIVSKLDAIKLQLINITTGGFLSLALPNNKSSDTYIEALSKEWNTCLSAVKHEQPTPVSEIANKWPFPVKRLDRFPVLSKPTRIHVTIPSLQASYIRVCIKCDIYCAPDLTSSISFDQQLAQLPAIDYYAVGLLSHLLDRTDGPLYAAIRGKGYAYGAYFVNQAWEGILAFSCSSASDAPKAILAMQHLIKDVGQNWDEYVTDFEIGMAKSIQIYNKASNQATPSGMLETCERTNYLGFETAKQADIWRSTHLAAVTNQDLRRVYDQYLSKLGDPNYPAFTTLVAPSDTEIPPELGTFECRTLDSFVVPYSN